MRVERLLYPITALGPGKRIAVWIAGCTKRCLNCENPELWESTAKQEIEATSLAKEVIRIHKAYGADEITLTGGDPLEQGEELELFLTEIRPCFSDVLLYTGFTLAEIKRVLGDQGFKQLKKMVDVVIDGRYIDSKNDETSTLKGSSNQNIIFFSNRLKKKYEDYIARGRIVQNVAYNGRIISVGIHNRELLTEFHHE